jgi:hypothetical protein
LNKVHGKFAKNSVENPMQLNTNQLVKLAVTAEISHPTLRKTGYVTTSEGKVEVYPSVGGITYNCRIGDSAIDLMADHVEPGVSVRNNGPSIGEFSANGALNVLACIGNKATVVSGDANGSEGFVTGKHGGVDHVMIDFETDILYKLNIGDKLRIETWGTGLRLLDYFPDITVMNIDPNLLRKLSISENSSKTISIGVTHTIPAKVMGAGIGAISAYSGDYDIQMFDKAVVKKHRLGSLRFGDVVGVIDSDASHGWIFKEGAVTIGVIAHSKSVISGHGPGVTTILTSPTGKIIPEIDVRANLRNLF